MKGKRKRKATTTAMAIPMGIRRNVSVQNQRVSKLGVTVIPKIEVPAFAGTTGFSDWELIQSEHLRHSATPSKNPIHRV